MAEEKVQQIIIASIGKFEHKADDCRYRHSKNMEENSYQNIGENYENQQNLFLTSNTFS